MKARDLQRALSPIVRRVRMSISRAVLLAVDDTTLMQRVHVRLFNGEERDDAERFQDYGFSSVPPGKSEGVYLSLGGDRDHGVVLGMGNRKIRIKGQQQGEVALHTDEGDQILLKRGRLIEVTTKTFRLNAEDLVEINTKEYKLNASEKATSTTPQWTVVASTKAAYTTPLVETSAKLTVGGILTATNGYSLGGTLALGAPSTMDGDIRHLSGNIELCVNSGTLKHNNVDVGKLHKHKVLGGVGSDTDVVS